MQNAWIALPLLLVSLSLPAGGFAQAISGDTLRARLNADILSSDPASARDANTDAVLLHVVEGLVASREDGTVGPMLADRWTVSEDGRAYRFELRQDVRFHNGAPFTSADVAWAFGRYMAPASRWRCKAELGPQGIAQLLSVQPDGPHTVTMTLDRPAPLFLKTLARADCSGSGIVHRDSVDQNGAWRQPVGTGPFQWDSWRRGQYVELARFPEYRPLPGPRDGNGGGKHALVERVRFSVIPDGSAASAALLRGSLDVLDGLASNELGAVQAAPGIRLDIQPIMDFYGILFQTRDPVLADPRLRRAIAYSIDVAALTRVATHGVATPDSSPISTVSPYYGAVQQPVIGPDLAQARALVKASGYRGQTIRLLTSRAPPETFDVAILVQAMAREVGIRIEIVALDWATHFARYERGNYQAMVFGFSARLDPSLLFGALIGDKETDPRKVWDTPAARALLRASIETGDQAERQQIFDRLEQVFREDAPAIVLYNTKRVTALQADIAGYKSWPAQLQRLWDVARVAR